MNKAVSFADLMFAISIKFVRLEIVRNTYRKMGAKDKDNTRPKGMVPNESLCITFSPYLVMSTLSRHSYVAWTLFWPDKVRN